MAGTVPEEGQRSVTCMERVCMLLLGLINNIFYLIVASSAQRIVSHYGATGMLGMINWSCSFCGLFAGSVNAWLTTRNVSYDLRFSINGICMAIGLLGAAISPQFWMACASVLFVGFSCQFGESLALGYVAHIHKQSLVKFWGIGTGCAGVFGSGYSVLCVATNINYTYSFYVLLPLVIVYLLSYFVVIREKKTNDGPITSLQTQNEYEAITNEAQEEVKVFSWGFLKKIWYYAITIDLVYFAQYSITGAFLDCAQLKNGAEENAYMFPLLGMTKYIGNLIFCSAAGLIEFRWLGLLVIFQFINFGVWLSQAMLHWMSTWDQFILIFIVGSVSGLNYVSTYNMIMQDKNLSYKEKEIGANITAVTVTASVLIASCFTVISENTYLKPFVPE